MRRFYHPNPEEGSLSPEESKHIRKVLRLGPGDRFEILDGKGAIHTCTIGDNSDKQVRFTIEETERKDKPRMNVHLCIATIKDHGRMEWLVEKAVELGVQNISFFQANRSEKSNVRIPRLENKAIAAIKQSSNPWLPVVNQISWSEAIALDAELKLIGALSPSAQSINNYHQSAGTGVVLIGPEGGFSEEEERQASKNGFQFANLGAYTLRAETAAVVAAHSLLLER